MNENKKTGALVISHVEKFASSNEACRQVFYRTKNGTWTNGQGYFRYWPELVNPIGFHDN